MLRLEKLVGGMPGAKVVKTDANYLHAEFTSRLMRFVDDVEFLLDDANNLIHFRSASRIGHSDMGANRKRMETITGNFN